MYRNYSILRIVAVIAGILGILQSVAWIGLSITGIVAYYCQFDFTEFVGTVGKITELTLFHMYYHADNCFQPGLPVLPFSTLNGLDIMRPSEVHIWMWIYLAFSFIWFVSSVTLLTNVREKYIRWNNIFLYKWIMITVAVSVIDLAIGIMFALDYDVLMSHTHTVLLAENTHLSEYIIASAQLASGIMMTISFRAYIIWIVNISFCVYFFIETFKISDYNNLSPILTNGQSNQGYVDDRNGGHPIDAYGAKNVPNLWNAPQIPLEASKPRPRSAANDLFEERRRHYEIQSLPLQNPNLANNHNYQPPTQSNVRLRQDDIEARRSTAAAQVVRELSHRNSYNAVKPTAIRNDPNFPAPDYSPQLSRSNPYDARQQQQLRSAMRTNYK